MPEETKKVAITEGLIKSTILKIPRDVYQNEIASLLYANADKTKIVSEVLKDAIEDYEKSISLGDNSNSPNSDVGNPGHTSLDASKRNSGRLD